MRERILRVSNGLRLAGVVGVTLILIGIAAGSAGGATMLPVLWTAGGLSAGSDSAGQAARIASDASGNVAVVSGPSLRTRSGRHVVHGRWDRSAGADRSAPSIGTFIGDWVAAAPNGDFVAVGRNIDSHGNPIAITLVRFTSDGTLQWRRRSHAPASLRRTAAGRLAGQRVSGVQLGR